MNQPVPVKGAKGAGGVLLIVGVVAGVLVLIVGVLAAIAIPSFVGYQCKAKQSEAKANLKAAAVAMQSYQLENDAYPSSFDAAEWRPMGAKLRYEYSLVKSSAERFVLEAKGGPEMEGDLWRIDETMTLDHVENRCD